MASSELKTMGKQKGLSLRQIRLDFSFVNLRLLHIGHTNHNYVRLMNGFGHFRHFETMLLGDTNRLASFVKANDDLATAILEIQGVGVSL